MPSFNNTGLNTFGAINSLPLVTRYVEVKQTWNSQWLYVPYLSPLSCTRSVAPQIGRAILSYQFGTIKPEDSNTFTAFTPYNFQDWYVRISIQFPDNEPQPVWYGVVVETENHYQSEQTLMGEQRFTCLELSFLLNRINLYQSLAFPDSADDTTNTETLNYVPTFNERHWKGNDIQGNRSDVTAVFNEGESNEYETYIFQPTGQKWSNFDILQYLIMNYGPAALTFNITGSYQVLSFIQDVFEVGNSTLWDCLCRLIDPKRGLGCNLVVDDSSQEVYINVFTLTDTPITLGATTIPANQNLISFSYPTNFPFTHATGDVPFRTTSANTFDKLIIQGQRIKVVSVFSYKDNTLIEGWDTSTLQGAYVTSLGTDPIKNDRARAKNAYENVFTRHIVPRTWNWQTGAGDGSKPVQDNLAPTCKKDGTVDFSKPAGFWNGTNQLERQLPLKQGMDYTTYPPTNTDTDNDDPDFQPMFVAVYDNQNGAVHTADNKWHLIHKLQAANTTLHDSSVHNLDNELGFRLVASPNHYFALGHWNSPGATNVSPELDYKQLLVTAAFRTAQRQRITVTNPVQTENTKVKVLTIDNAEYWTVSANAPIAIDDNGNLQTINVQNGVLRNDIALLQAVAATASAWYFSKRQAVEIPIKQIGLYVALGAFLKSISSFNGVEVVRTPVSGITIDFQGNTTTITTAYHELDFTSFARRFH